MSQKYAHLDADRFVIGFYDDEWHGDAIPSDAIAISDEQHQWLLAGQATGKRMKVDADGAHALVDRAPPTDDELAVSLRSQRDAALTATDGLVARHRDQQEAGTRTTLTVDQYKALQAYRQALRDVPAADGFPHVELPTAPDFIGV